MSTLLQGNQLRQLTLGARATKTQALSAATLPIFTVAGGEVLITAFYLRVTTTIAAAGGTLALQHNPTTGDTATSLVTATDLGTSDATAGTVIGVREVAVADASAVPYNFAENGVALTGVVASTGQLELVGASGVDGAVQAVVCWVPLTDGATLVAA